MMRFTVLVENTSMTPSLQAEHGLSLLLETATERWLFDLGASDAFLKNAMTLGCSLSPLTGVVISHGHNDHGGGLGAWIAYNQQTPIYLSHKAFGDYYNRTSQPIGLSLELQSAPMLRRCEQTTILSAEATLVYLDPSQNKFPINAYGLLQREDGLLKPDCFAHEVALLLQTSGKRVLVSGCAHCGLLNYLDAYQPDVFIGGFHFARLNVENPIDSAFLEELATRLEALPTTFYTGHCTGKAPYEFLKKRLGNRLHALTTGASFQCF